MAEVASLSVCNQDHTQIHVHAGFILHYSLKDPALTGCCHGNKVIPSEYV